MRLWPSSQQCTNNFQCSACALIEWRGVRQETNLKSRRNWRDKIYLTPTSYSFAAAAVKSLRFLWWKWPKCLWGGATPVAKSAWGLIPLPSEDGSAVWGLGLVQRRGKSLSLTWRRSLFLKHHSSVCKGKLSLSPYFYRWVTSARDVRPLWGEVVL